MSEWWNEERVGQLRKLWADGKSATEIAVHFGTVSRNAVLGKVHRLRLADRPTVSKHTPKTRPVFNRPRLVEKQKPAAPPKPKPELPVFEKGDRLDMSRYRLPDCEPIPFTVALERGGRCKWILQDMDEKAGPETLCCGAATERGGDVWKPFCAAHAQLAYTTAPVR
jgi:GcrA cell cycle regulator